MTFDSETGAADNLSITNPNHLLHTPTSLDITSDAIILELINSTPSDHVLPGNGNAASVASALTKILANSYSLEQTSQGNRAFPGQTAFGDMLTQLFTESEAAFNTALDQMQPTKFKGLAI